MAASTTSASSSASASAGGGSTRRIAGPGQDGVHGGDEHAPAAARPTRYDAELTTVSASRRPPPDAARAFTRSFTAGAWTVRKAAGASGANVPGVQRAARPDAVSVSFEQLLRHLDERDRAFPWMHPGGEQNLRLSGGRGSPRVVRDTVAERYESKAGACHRDELLALFWIKVEHGAGFAEHLSGPHRVQRCGKRMARRHNHSMGLQEVRDPVSARGHRRRQRD